MCPWSQQRHSGCSRLLDCIAPYVLDVTFVFHLFLCFTWGTFRFYKANDHVFLESEFFFYSPFLPACLSHFTIKVYASVNLPHHVGFGEGLFLAAFCCVRAWQLCSVEFFSVYIDRMILNQLPNHTSVCSIRKMWTCWISDFWFLSKNPI